MRSLRKSWIGIILIFLFTISLFFWRQGSRLSNIFDSDNVIAEVGNIPISTTKFNRTLQMNIQKFNRMLSKELTAEEIRRMQIHQLALGALVNDAVFENEFNNLNFKLDETIIAKKTKEVIPQLYDDNNELDENYLNQFLSQQRLKIEDIVQIVHYDARNEYFKSAFLNIGFPSSFSDKIVAYNIHSRDIEYLKIPINSIDITKVLKDNEDKLDNVLSEYYEKNISQYMSDEKRDIEYILINKGDFISSFTPTENEVLEYYNNNSDLYFENEQRSFLQFNFKTQDKIEEFLKKIESIDTNEEIISYSNKENIKYSVFDNLGKDEILEEISKSLFSLNINEKSQIIKSLIGYHLVILKSIIPEKQLSFNEVKEEIINTISDSDVKNFLIDLENKISQDILEGFDLKQIVNKYELKLSFLKNTTKNFNKFDKKKEVLFNSIIKNAFIANLNFTSDIIKLNQDQFYAYEVVNIINSQPLDFNDMKDHILEDWKRFKQVERIEFEIKNNNTNQNFLKNLEREFSKKIDNLSITFSNNSIPKELIVDIFNSNLETITYIVDEDEIHLSKLIKVNIEEKSDKVKEKISLNNEMRNAFYNELIKETTISTNDQLFNAILDTY